METPFDKLRLPPSTRRAIAACVIGGAGLAARALGAVVTLPQNVTAGGVKYSSVRLNTATVPKAGGGNVVSIYGIEDATFHGKTDSFDGAVGIQVNGTAFNPPGGLVDRTTTSA